jgi:hypothetical protein
MLSIEELSGLWTRSLQAWADGRRDVSTEVAWLQGPRIFADLRKPPGLTGQFAHAQCLHGLGFSDCEKLARQQGFAGTFSSHDGYFEWTRQIDYQPAQGKIDAGRLFWRDDILVEEGLQKEHFEHWHRDPALPLSPCWGYILRGAADGCWGNLLRVGNVFMYARDRATPLVNGNLSDAVRGAASVKAARELIDFEISFGTASADGWRITRSTLPYREGARFEFHLQGETYLHSEDITPGGKKLSRVWEIITAEGNLYGESDLRHDDRVQTLPRASAMLPQALTQKIK